MTSADAYWQRRGARPGGEIAGCVLQIIGQPVGAELRSRQAAQTLHQVGSTLQRTGGTVGGVAGGIIRGPEGAAAGNVVGQKVDPDLIREGINACQELNRRAQRLERNARKVFGF